MLYLMIKVPGLMNASSHLEAKAQHLGEGLAKKAIKGCDGSYHPGVERIVMLTTARVAVFAWSWRRPLLATAAALIGLPALIAGMAVQAQQGHVGPLLMPVSHATLTQPFGCTTLAIEPSSEACAGGHFHSGIDLGGGTRYPDPRGDRWGGDDPPGSAAATGSTPW